MESIKNFNLPADRSTGENFMKTTKFEIKDAIKSSHRRENNQGLKTFQLIAFDKSRISKYDNGFRVLVDVRIYFTGGLRVYACVWINDSKNNVHGSGSAAVGGGNYDKISAAAANALEAAGIEFDQEVNGRGESVLEEALQAIGKHLGYEHYFVNRTYA